MESRDQILSFQLTNARTRQIFEYDLEGGKVKMMCDSGAQIPVWCVGESPLKVAYPDVVKTDLTGHITGFGKDSEECSIFCIPMFSLKSGDTEFRIKDLLVARPAQAQNGGNDGNGVDRPQNPGENVERISIRDLDQRSADARKTMARQHLQAQRGKLLEQERQRQQGAVH